MVTINVENIATILLDDALDRIDEAKEARDYTALKEACEVFNRYLQKYGDILSPEKRKMCDEMFPYANEYYVKAQICLGEKPRSLGS